MDWLNVEPDVYKLLTKNFTEGRGDKNIEMIVIHHNAAKLSIDEIYNVWQVREASAHYQVDINGLVGQLVHDKDTAWHSGNWDVNQKSIGIEHANSSTSPWLVGPKTIESGAHLVAALCRFYSLGRPKWGVNVFPHSNFTSTSCPASLQGVQHEAYMTRAQQWYDAMVNDSSAPAPVEVKPNPATPAPVVNKPQRVDFKPYPFDPNGWHRFGLITGPNELHGGYYENERIHVKNIQRWLVRHGYAGNVNEDQWADGLYEQPTVDAVIAFQKAEMPGTTYWGEVWADDYARMMSNNG